MYITNTLFLQVSSLFFPIIIRKSAIINRCAGKVLTKTSETIALFHEVKSAVVARLFEGAARVSQSPALEPME